MCKFKIPNPHESKREWVVIPIIRPTMKSRMMDMNFINEIISLIYINVSLMKEGNKLVPVKQVSGSSFSPQTRY